MLKPGCQSWHLLLETCCNLKSESSESSSGRRWAICRATESWNSVRRTFLGTVGSGRQNCGSTEALVRIARDNSMDCPQRGCAKLPV